MEENKNLKYLQYVRTFLYQSTVLFSFSTFLGSSVLFLLCAVLVHLFKLWYHVTTFHSSVSSSMDL